MTTIYKLVPAAIVLMLSTISCKALLTDIRDLDTEGNPGTNADKDTNTNGMEATDGDTDTGVVGDTDSDSDNDTGTDVVSDTDVDGDTDTDVDGDSDTDVDGDTDTDVDGDTDTDVDGDSDTDVDGDTDTDVDGDTDTDTDVDGDTDTDVDGDTDTDVDGDTDTDADSDTETGSQSTDTASTDTETVEGGTDTSPEESETDTYPKPDHNYAFLTSTKQSAALGGLTGADALCQQRAEAAGLLGQYKAYLNSYETPAHTRFTDVTGWYRTDGRPFANTLTDAESMDVLFYPVLLDEFGNDLSGDATFFSGWTGRAQDCGNWQSSGSLDPVRLGDPTLTWSWTHGTQGAMCDTERRLLCLGVSVNETITPEAPNHRLAFISNEIDSANRTLDRMTAVCQDEFNEAYGADTGREFIALLATSTQSAADAVTSTSKVPWARPDGVEIAATSDDFLSGRWLTFLHLKLDGEPSNDTTVWHGASSFGGSAESPADSCGDWTSGSYADTGLIVYIDSLNLHMGSTFDCDFDLPVICIEN